MFVNDLTSLGYDVWYDNETIALGQSIPCEMNNGIEKADFMILLTSTEYFESNFCNDEWMAFYQKNNKDNPNKIILILMEENIKLPSLLAHYKYYDYTADNDYNKMFASIAQRIKMNID